MMMMEERLKDMNVAQKPCPVAYGYIDADGNFHRHAPPSL